jgi:acyl transferase domain-containing protein
MGLESEGEIISAKHQFYISSEPADQTKAIDTLAAYGEQAIDFITEVINLSDISDQVRDHGREAIEGITGQS